MRKFLVVLGAVTLAAACQNDRAPRTDDELRMDGDSSAPILRPGDDERTGFEDERDEARRDARELGDDTRHEMNEAGERMEHEGEEVREDLRD